MLLRSFSPPIALALASAASLAACSGPHRAAGDANVASAEDERALAPEELLGKRLFEDVTLSEPAGVSCASCHDPTRAFQGNNGSSVPAVARGSRAGALGTRNAPTLLYASLAPPFDFVQTGKEGPASRFIYAPVGGLFWDGRADTLAEQAKAPITNPREMNATPAAFVAKVRSGAYAKLARDVIGATLDVPDAAFDALAAALAAFERTPRFHPYRSKFDDSLRGTATLSPAESRGFALFKDPYKGNCVSCHAGVVDSRRPEDWPFTDFTYSAVGAPRNGAIADNADPSHYDLGLCDSPKLAAHLPPGAARESYCGSFRVPSLRNVAVTAPYMHNGFFSDLRDVVRFYATRDTNLELWYPTDAHHWITQFDDLPLRFRGLVSTDEVPYDRVRGELPRLDGEEIDDVTAFLLTLTDR